MKHPFYRIAISIIILFQSSFNPVFSHSNHNDTDKKLHRWAIQSHREFWTLIGKSAGYEAMNDQYYQYVRSPYPKGLNYIYIAPECQRDDAVVYHMKDRFFTIFFDADDDRHIFKYVTLFEEANDFTTMGLDLTLLPKKISLKSSDLKVWKVTTDEEFDQWIKVTALRHNLNEESSLKAYFQNFKPSKKNPAISFYLGSIHGKIVGTSLVYFSKDFASLYWVGVHPNYRRQGLGAFLSYEPLKEALQKGYRWSVLQAQPMGVPVYPKLGFKKVGRMKVFYYIKGH